jgi:hypothetical protein
MTKLEPCPFCGETLRRVDSVARALDQEKGGRPVWEYYHSRNGCILLGRSWCFDPVCAPDDQFVVAWNQRRTRPAITELQRCYHESGLLRAALAEVFADHNAVNNLAWTDRAAAALGGDDADQI